MSQHAEFEAGQTLTFADRSRWIVVAVSPSNDVTIAKIGEAGMTVPAERLLQLLGDGR